MSSVVVRIAGDDTQLQAALTRAQKGLAQFREQTNATISTLAKYGAAVTATGAAIVTALVTKQSQAIDATAKFSDQIGISTTELTQYQYAAREAANVTDSTFNQALRRMTRRIAEAAEGAGPAANTIKELGLSANELKAAGPAAALRQIADAMKNTEAQGDRLRHAFALFDTEGGNLLPMLQQGSEGLREYAEEADALGQSFSRIDAAQVEAANSAMARIRNVITGIGNQLAIQLAPYIQEVAQRFTDLSKTSGGFGSVVGNVVERVMKGFGGVANAVHYVKVGMSSLLVAAQGLGNALVGIASMIVEGWARLFNMILGGIENVVKAANRIPGVKIPTEGLENFRRSVQAQADAQKDMRDQMSASLKQSMNDLHELAMQPLPSAAVDEFLADVKEKSRAAAEEMAAAREQVFPGGPVAANDAGDGGDDGEQEKQERALDAIRNRYLTEQELLRQHQETMLLIGEEYDAAKFETEEEWRSIREQAEQEHMDKLASIRERGLSRIERFQAMSFDNQVKQVTGALADMTAGVSSENKRMFELNKVAGIANATISAYQGISTTLGAYPFPLSVAMAAAQGAAAFAQVDAIRKQSFSGGGGAAPSLAGGTPATPSTDVQGGTPQGGGGGGTYRIEGVTADSILTGDALINLLSDMQEDGAFRGKVVFG